MNLLQAITDIQYSSNWGIWAEEPFTPESEARYGQRQFENGGILDDKVFFADGVQCGNFIMSYLDGEDASEFGEEAAREMIYEYSSGEY